MDEQLDNILAAYGVEQASPAGDNVHNEYNFGDTTRDEVLKRELLRRIVTVSSGSLSVGTNVVGTQQMDQLGTEFEYATHTSAEYPVDHDTTTDRRYVEWKKFKIRLYQAQARFFMSDGAKLEGFADMHLEHQRQVTSEALARRKDENILGTLANGAYSENEQAASEFWNATDSQDEAPIIDELWEMWEQILVNAPLSSLDETSMAVILPAQVYTQVNRLKLINNIQQRVRDHLNQTFNFTLYPTKLGMHPDDQVEEKHGVNMQDTAIMLLPGDQTAIHGELAASAAAERGVPLVEGPNREFGRGEDYLIKEWFNTAIMEHETGNEGESPRIAVRTGVNEHENPT